MRAVGYWQRAGEQARSHAADIEAIAHFRKGLEELRTATSLARLWQRQGKRQDAYDLLRS